jgi:hypothetical protein
VSQLICADPGREPLRVDEGCNGLAEGVGGDPLQLELGTNPPPLLADRGWILQHTGLSREDGIDGGFHFGRNTSSIQYKENVRTHNTDPANVLALQPVIYDRIDGGSNEYGLIAEQVAEHFPELIVWFDGKIDGLRYDLLPVALLDVVRDQENRIRALEGREPLPPRTTVPNIPSAGAPAVQRVPLPYAIQSAS